MCRALEGGACFGQLHLYNGMLVESVCCNFQLREEKHKDHMVQGLGQHELEDNPHPFPGAESAHGVCVRPALQAWVADGRESAILEERRTAGRAAVGRGPSQGRPR